MTRRTPSGRYSNPLYISWPAPSCSSTHPHTAKELCECARVPPSFSRFGAFTQPRNACARECTCTCLPFTRANRGKLIALSLLRGHCVVWRPSRHASSLIVTRCTTHTQRASSQDVRQIAEGVMYSTNATCEYFIDLTHSLTHVFPLCLLTMHRLTPPCV